MLIFPQFFTVCTDGYLWKGSSCWLFFPTLVQRKLDCFFLLSVEAGKPGWLAQWWYCQVKQQGLFVNKCWGDPHLPFTGDSLKMKTAYSLPNVNVHGYLGWWKERRSGEGILRKMKRNKNDKMVVFILNGLLIKVRYLSSLHPPPCHRGNKAGRRKGKKKRLTGEAGSSRPLPLGLSLL